MSLKGLHDNRTLLSLATLFLCIGVLMLWQTNTLTRYIHPRYELFTSSLTLMGGLLVGFDLFRAKEKQANPRFTTIVTLLVCAIALMLPVQTLSSRAALNREQTDVIINNRLEISSYDAFSKDLSYLTLSEWATLLSSNPEPDDIVGKNATIEGFALLDGDKAYLARFRIACCSVDATPVTVQLATMQVSSIESNAWYRIDGTFIVEDNKLVIAPSAVTAIEEPDDPYIF